MLLDIEKTEMMVMASIKVCHQATFLISPEEHTCNLDINYNQTAAFSCKKKLFHA